MAKSQEEFQKDILEITKKQNQEISELSNKTSEALKAVNEFIEKSDTNSPSAAMRTEGGGFVCDIDIKSFTDEIVPPEVWNTKLATLQKELISLMLRNKISVLSASLVKKYGQKKETP